MALTALQAKQAKPRDKDYKLSDEKGMYLHVKKSGSKYWRLKYRMDGKEKLLAIGVYPDTDLKKARDKRDDARRLLADGIDPNAVKQSSKQARRQALADSFEVVSLEWYAKQHPHWSKSHSDRVLRSIQRDLIPHIGSKPLNDLSPVDVLHTLRRVEARGAIETAHRVKQVAGQVFRYGIATGRAERDPTQDLAGALQKPIEKHLAAITNPAEVAQLMKAIDGYRGTPTVEAALKLSPLLFCRPGELRHLEWQEVNWEEARIEIPAEKMKLKEPHIIPLASQALEILKELEPLTGNGLYVFPSARGRSRPLSDNGVRTAIRSLGYDNETMTPHGFRAMARTLLDEVLGFRIEWIEQQLAHQVKDANGRAYNRTKHLKQRAEMMQVWADYLTGEQE